MKRTISLLLALLLALSLGTVQVTAGAEEAKPVLTIAREANVLIEDLDTNAFTQMLEDTLGVELEFEIYSEAAAKLSLLVAANAELPDIINFPLDDATVFKYGSTGVFQNLNEYYANEEISPNFHALTQEHQDIMLSSIVMANGERYSMPQIGFYLPNNMCYHLMINKNWLDQLNMEMPTTTDELRTVLEAFKANDLNGNGLNDEIPMMGSTRGWGSDIAAVLLGSFTQINTTANYFYPKDGVIQAAFMEDEFREGLKYIAGLIDDGLLDSTSFTQTRDQLVAICNSDVAMVGVIQDRGWPFNAPADVGPSYNLLYDHPVCSQYVYLEIPTGPNGAHNVNYQPDGVNQLFFITSDCDDPELAFRLGDLGYDPYNSLISRHGTEGENWTRDPEVLKNYEAATIDGVTMEPTWVLLDDPWGHTQNKHWMQQYPGCFTFDFNLTLGQPKDPRLSILELVYAMNKDDVPAEYIGKQVYTEEEVEELSMIQIAIDDYVRECITAFATGNMDVENDWDRYINELKSMDVERYLEIVQNGYDRAHS